ncbi:hypothetical protein MASR2M74_08300 [Paracoccaceae bacterium]
MRAGPGLDQHAGGFGAQGGGEGGKGGGGEAGELPVQGDVERAVGGEFHEVACGQVGRHQRFGVEAPTEAGQAGLDKALGGGEAVAGKGGAAGALADVAGDPAVLQAVLVGKGQGGGAAQRLGRGALGHPARHVARGGGGAVAQGAEGQRLAARGGGGMGGDGAHHLAAPEPVLADVLIVDHQIEEKARAAGQRRDDPCRKAVGIYGQTQGGRAGGQLRQVGGKALFQKRNLVMVADQPQPGGGGGAGGATGDQEGAGGLFQRLEPLRDGGRGDVELRGGEVEGAAAVDGGEGGELGGVGHGSVLWSAPGRCPRAYRFLNRWRTDLRTRDIWAKIKAGVRLAELIRY